MNDPKLIQLRGANFALYSSGIKRGHAESGQEYASNFARLASQYETAAKQCADAGQGVHVGRSQIYAQVATTLREMEGQARAVAKDCQRDAGGHLDRGCAIIQEETAARERVRLATLAPRKSIWREGLDWFIRFAG